MGTSFAGAWRAGRPLAALAAPLLAAALAGCTPAPPPPDPGPAVSASPSTGLVDGQTVTLRGSGYSANAPVGVVQCRAGATSIDQCDGRTADSFSADAAGAYTRRMAVHAQVVDAHGVATDCTSAPGACVVSSVYIHGFQGLATAPLSFG